MAEDQRWDAFPASQPTAAALDPWAAFPKTTATPANESSVAGDVIKSGASGIGKGLTYLAGTPGDVRELNANVINYLSKQLGHEIPAEKVSAALKYSGLPGASGPTSQQLQSGAEQVTGKFHEPETTAGKFAHTVGEFVPGALAGPMGAGRSMLGNVARYAAVPGIAAEAAGQGAEALGMPEAAPWAKAAVGIGTGGLMAARDRPHVPAQVKVGENVAPDMGIRLSQGQADKSHDAIMMEQAALRGGFGPKAQQVAQDFFENQRGDIDIARDLLGRNLDRFGANIVENPLAAGELISDTLTKVAAASKQGYKGLYDEFAALPGEVHAGAVEGIGQKIKGKLTLRDDPVVIDDVTTPVASRAIKDIDEYIGQMRVQNRADPFGEPNVENIVGLSLKGIDQTRKRLIKMNTAVNPINGADRRAMRSIIRSFDDHIEDAISGGLFTGDERALPVLKAARKAFNEHRTTFTGNVKDPLEKQVGRAIENIVGRDGGEGSTANEVANYLYGESKIGAKGMSVRLTDRLKGILGADSPEWTGVRQGLWQRLTQVPEGQTPMGTQKVAQRITDFVNGSGKSMADRVFTPQERQQMARFAKALNEVTPPQSTINWSNTATVGSRMAAHSLAALQKMFGFATHALGPVGSEMANRIGANFLQNARDTRSVRRSLYGKEQRPTTPDVAKNILSTGAIGAHGD